MPVVCTPFPQRISGGAYPTLADRSTFAFNLPSKSFYFVERALAQAKPAFMTVAQRKPGTSQGILDHGHCIFGRSMVRA